jgi:hypothetical protein
VFSLSSPSTSPRVSHFISERERERDGREKITLPTKECENEREGEGDDDANYVTTMTTAPICRRA